MVPFVVLWPYAIILSVILYLNKVDLSMHMIRQLRILKAVLLLFIETYKGNTDHLNRSAYKGHTRTIFPVILHYTITGQFAHLKHCPEMEND